MGGLAPPRAACNQCRVSGETTAPGIAHAPGDAIRDWEAVRAATDIQYAPLAVPPPPAPKPPPEWLELLGTMLKAVFEPLGRLLGLSWPVLEKLLVGLAAIAVLLLVWRIGRALLTARRRAAAASATAEPAWAPSAESARALLDDADRLAAEGRYDEATHLLLRRSVADIAESRPDLLRPASTAREIAVLPVLPQAARDAFGVIAERVERSLFALRPLGAEDWNAARGAYARFALAGAVGQ